jgi:hypothetical protein
LVKAKPQPALKPRLIIAADVVGGAEANLFFLLKTLFYRN